MISSLVNTPTQSMGLGRVAAHVGSPLAAIEGRADSRPDEVDEEPFKFALVIDGDAREGLRA